jgi:hypothetical protein
MRCSCLEAFINCGSKTRLTGHPYTIIFLKWDKRDERFTQQLGNLLSFRAQLIISLSEEKQFSNRNCRETTTYFVHNTPFTESCSVVDIVTRLGVGPPTNLSSIPGRDKRFVYSADVWDLLWGTYSVFHKSLRDFGGTYETRCTAPYSVRIASCFFRSKAATLLPFSGLCPTTACTVATLPLPHGVRDSLMN